MNVDKVVSELNLSTNKIKAGKINGNTIILNSEEDSVRIELNNYVKFEDDYSWLYNGSKKIKDMTDEYIKEQLVFISKHNKTPYFITWKYIFNYELKKRRKDKLNKICGR